MAVDPRARGYFALSMRSPCFSGPDVAGGADVQDVWVDGATPPHPIPAVASEMSDLPDGKAPPPTPQEPLRGISTNTAPLPANLSAQLGMAKALNIMSGMDNEGFCSVEKTSCYGAWIVLTQVSRSVGWPGSLCGLMSRSFIFLMMNHVVQTAFIYYIYDSQTNMNPFGGQMHLCDFGKHISDCPNRPNCHGPGGSEMPNPGSLYPYDIFNTRKFVRDALTTMFPDMQELIAENVDPGEYGIESYYCRLLCIFVFVLQIADEFQNIRDLCWFIWKVPTEEGLWVEFDSEAPAPDDDPHGQKELDSIKFKVAGVPLRWKILITIFVLIPRIFIWRMLTLAGVHFLMETAAMVDQIVNTTALSFVLCTDELVHERLTCSATKHIVSSVEDYTCYEHKEDSNQALLTFYRDHELAPLLSPQAQHKFPMLPYKLVWTIVLMAAFVYEYYWHNCTSMDDGSSVSVPVAYPPGSHMTMPTFFSKFLSVMDHNNHNVPFWTMPTR